MSGKRKGDEAIPEHRRSVIQAMLDSGCSIQDVAERFSVCGDNAREFITKHKLLKPSVTTGKAMPWQPPPDKLIRVYRDEYGRKVSVYAPRYAAGISGDQLPEDEIW